MEEEKIEELKEQLLADIANAVSKCLSDWHAQAAADYRPTRELLAYICNDTEHIEDYRVDGMEAYYKDDHVGDFEIADDEIRYIPIKAVHKITVNVTVLKDGVVINESGDKAKVLIELNKDKEDETD